MPPFRIAMISLDSSHSVELTRLMQGDAAPADLVPGLRVVSCCRFPSRFQPEDGQDKRQAQLEAWGAPLAASPEEAARDADGLIISLNDPADHFPLMERLVKLGKPIFLDKPLADTVEHGRAILDGAAKAGVALWSASSIPLIPSLLATRRAVPTPVFAHAYGPLGQAPAGSSVVWYGCHTFESMAALMGADAVSVRAAADERGVVARIVYPHGRGVVELNTGAYIYGGRAGDDKETRSYRLEADTPIYRELVLALRNFFLYGATPLPLANAFAALRLAEATENSLARDGAEVTL